MADAATQYIGASQLSRRSSCLVVALAKTGSEDGSLLVSPLI